MLTQFIKASVVFIPIVLFAQITFTEPQLIREHTAGSAPIQSDLGDFDQDGDLDVIVSSMRSPALYWVENTDGQGLFGSRTVISEHLDGYFWHIDLADLDADGWVDVIAMLEGQSARLVWFKNPGAQPGPWPMSVLEAPNTEFCSGPLAIADLDGDADLDISAYNCERGLFWLVNEGQGQFSS